MMYELIQFSILSLLLVEFNYFVEGKCSLNEGLNVDHVHTNDEWIIFVVSRNTEWFSGIEFIGICWTDVFVYIVYRILAIYISNVYNWIKIHRLTLCALSG